MCGCLLLARSARGETAYNRERPTRCGGERESESEGVCVCESENARAVEKGIESERETARRGGR